MTTPSSSPADAGRATDTHRTYRLPLTSRRTLCCKRRSGVTCFMIEQSSRLRIESTRFSIPTESSSSIMAVLPSLIRLPNWSDGKDGSTSSSGRLVCSTVWSHRSSLAPTVVQRGSGGRRVPDHRVRLKSSGPRGLALCCRYRMFCIHQKIPLKAYIEEDDLCRHHLRESVSGGRLNETGPKLHFRVPSLHPTIRVGRCTSGSSRQHGYWVSDGSQSRKCLTRNGLFPLQPSAWLNSPPSTFTRRVKGAIVPVIFQGSVAGREAVLGLRQQRAGEQVRPRTGYDQAETGPLLEGNDELYHFEKSFAAIVSDLTSEDCYRATTVCLSSHRCPGRYSK